jgi:DNA-binding GntR family transcriptional regulator
MQTKAQRPSLVDRAYAEIKRRILDNTYTPNLQVYEQELALQLGMSRTPVREALIRLEREGLVQIVPRRGMRVVPVSPSDMRDIYEVITCLEAQAAGRLAARKPSRDEVQVLIDDVEAMDRALAKKDLEDWAAADADFHGHLLELCGNRRLAQVAGAIADQAHRARMVTLHMRPLPLRSNEDHRAVIEAILAGDARRAHDVHERHRRNAMELLTEILQRYNLSQL